MKVLIISPSTERTKGGMATVVKNILNDSELKKEHTLTYIASHVEGSIIKKLYVFINALVYVILKHKSYDIMHLHMASFGSFYRKGIFLLIGRLMRKRVIIHMHGAEFDDFFNQSNRFVKKIIIFIFGLSHKTLVLSESWKEFFEHNIVKENVVVLKNGVDVESFNQCIKQNSQFETYVFLGRLGVRKGVYDLLEAMRHIVNERKIRTLKLYLAGDGEIDEVTDRIQQYNLQEYVFVTGWVEASRKIELLKESDVMILPSYDEGLPVSLIEGIACGKVIISTTVGGIPELIEQGKNGFLFQPGDISTLSKYIIDTNTQKEEMRQICKNNILKAKQDYDLKKINQILSEIYMEVI